MKKDIGWATTKETGKYQGIHKYKNTVMIYVKKEKVNLHIDIFTNQLPYKSRFPKSECLRLSNFSVVCIQGPIDQ